MSRNHTLQRFALVVSGVIASGALLLDAGCSSPSTGDDGPDGDGDADAENTGEDGGDACLEEGIECSEHGDGCSACNRPDREIIDAQCTGNPYEVCCRTRVRPCEEFEQTDEYLPDPVCVSTSEECEDSDDWATSFSTAGLCPESRPFCCVVRACMGEA